jgi:phage terminase small subunit
MTANEQRKTNRKLTTKQQRFVDLYSGNATEAARKAGYKASEGSLRAIGAQNLTKLNIRAAIQGREKKRNEPHIASREERQGFWSDVMRDEKAKMADRLKSSEYLGRSEGDFLDRTKHEGGGVRVIGLKEALDAAEGTGGPLIKEQ